MAEDKLFETGCALCGGEPGPRPYTFGTGYSVCLGCSDQFGGNSYAELNRRRSLESASPPAGFKVGDFVEGTNTATATKFRGRLLGFVGKEAKIEDLNSDFPWYVEASSLRYAPAPAPSEQIPDEFYGTMPVGDELPRTLPIGTRACYIKSGGEFYDEPGLTALTEQRLSGQKYIGQWRHDNGEIRDSAPNASVDVASIHWKSVRKPQPGQTPAFQGVDRPGPRASLSDPTRKPTEAAVIAANGLDAPICGDCGKPIENALEACRRAHWNERTQRRELTPGVFHSTCPETTPDPYASHKEPELDHVYVTDCGRQRDRIAALSTSDHPLDRLAARKQRQRGEVLAEMSRARTYRDRMGVERTWDGRRVK